MHIILKQFCTNRGKAVKFSIMTPIKSPIYAARDLVISLSREKGRNFFAG